MDEVSAYLAFGGLLYTVMKFYGFIEAKDYKSARTQVIAWVAGVVVVLLAAQTSFATGIASIGDATLGTATLVDQIFIGLTVAGLAGTAYGAIKSRGDNTATAIVEQPKSD